MVMGKRSVQSGVLVLWLAGLMPYGYGAQAEKSTSACPASQVIPLTETEPAPRLFVDPPLPEPLASRGVAIIPYCAAHMRLEPVFGPGALTVSPRVGHVHVTVDSAPWHWADASGNPIILRGLPPGPHTVLIELADANHGIVDKASVKFDVPARPAIEEMAEPITVIRVGPPIAVR